LMSAPYAPVNGRMQAFRMFNALRHQINPREVRRKRTVLQETAQNAASATAHVENLFLGQIGKVMPFEQRQQATLQALRMLEGRLIEKVEASGRNFGGAA